MSSALNIVFNQVGETVNVEIGAGRWVDKAIAGTVSLLVIWPLAITVCIGAWQQEKIPEKIYKHISDFLDKAIFLNT